MSTEYITDPRAILSIPPDSAIDEGGFPEDTGLVFPAQYDAEVVVEFGVLDANGNFVTKLSTEGLGNPMFSIFEEACYFPAAEDAGLPNGEAPAGTVLLSWTRVPEVDNLFSYDPISGEHKGVTHVRLVFRVVEIS